MTAIYGMIIKTLFFVVILTIILFYIENRSNFPSGIIIPIITAILTKYTLGDWDIGYKWTKLDILYWLSIISTSYGTFYALSLKEKLY